MDLAVLRYIAFIVVILIFIWAVFEVRTRLIRRKELDITSLNRWEKLDSTSRAHDVEEGSMPFVDEEDGEEEQVKEVDVHARAHQNGHYLPSKKKL